jgi:hypothetical protein
MVGSLFKSNRQLVEKVGCSLPPLYLRMLQHHLYEVIGEATGSNFNLMHNRGRCRRLLFGLPRWRVMALPTSLVAKPTMKQVEMVKLRVLKPRKSKHE